MGMMAKSYTCFCCDKYIEPLSFNMEDYAYRIKGTKDYIFCSWSCMRKFERNTKVRRHHYVRRGLN